MKKNKKPTAKQIMDICGGQWMRYNIPGNNIIDSHKKIGDIILNPVPSRIT